ncbi:MAG: hypothetical protein AB1640_03950 [bacterium]
MVEKTPPNKSSDQEEASPHLPEYKPPKIVTYTSEEILEQIGPAQACSPGPCVIQ